MRAISGLIVSVLMQKSGYFSKEHDLNQRLIPRKPNSNNLKVSRLIIWVLVTFRASLIL